MNAEQKKKNICYWVEGSEKDLVGAKNIAKLAKANSQALFFLHLSIEKALKALFVDSNSNFAPLSHNLLMLAEKSNLVLDDLQSLKLATINEFNLQTRYPNEIDELDQLATDAYTEKQLQEGEVIQKWILGQLKKTC